MSKLTEAAKFDVVISSIVDVPKQEDHPFISIATFILADDKPNGNKQAVDYSEFDNIRRTAINMPVKMNFLGSDIADHAGSIPIGVIRSIEEVELSDGSHQLIAEAALWKEEYPEEISFLKTKFEEGDAPGVSYELGYAESETKGGVQWIKKVVTLAATFVKHPAYEGRTKLLAFASSEVTPDVLASAVMDVVTAKQLDFSEVIQKLQAQIENPDGESSDEGGNQMEELEQQKALAASLQTQIDDLTTQLADKDKVIGERDDEIKGLKFAALIDSRTRKFVEAGFTLEADAEKAEKKKALWASLNDEQFDEYLGDLVEAKKAAAPAAPASTALAAIAQASLGSAMPRPQSVVAEGTDLGALKSAMRGLARPNSIE